jgi:hypothetical protein
MRNFKKLGALAVAVLALSAIGAASASASEMTASATGSLTGKALNNQVFTFNGGTVACSNVAVSGTIQSTAASFWHVTKTYSSCTAFGFATVDLKVETINYTFFGFGDTHIQTALIFTPTFFGASMCTVTMGEQMVGTVDYSNASASTVKVNSTITGIQYTSTGGSCGSSGENGTFTGAIEISRVGGGSVQYDA